MKNIKRSIRSILTLDEIASIITEIENGERG